MIDKILRWPEVHKLVGISRATVDRQEARGRFPRRQQLTDYTVGWRLSEVQAWIAGKREWSDTLAKSA